MLDYGAAPNQMFVSHPSGRRRWMTDRFSASRENGPALILVSQWGAPLDRPSASLISPSLPHSPILLLS